MRRPCASPTRAHRRRCSGRQLNLPPYYLLIHRVTLGGIGVLCQIGATVPVREEMARLMPGFLDDEGRYPDGTMPARRRPRAPLSNAAGRPAPGPGVRHLRAGPTAVIACWRYDPGRCAAGHGTWRGRPRWHGV